MFNQTQVSGSRVIEKKLEETEGSTLIGHKGRSVHECLSDTIKVLDYVDLSPGWSVAADTARFDWSASIQAAMDAAQNKKVIFPNNLLGTSKPIKYRTGCHVVGEGVNSGIVAYNLEAFDMQEFEQPNDEQSYGSLALTKPPVFYNPTPIQFWKIENMTFRGVFENVYGLFLYGNYYGKLDNVLTFQCGAEGYVNIRGQVVRHSRFTNYQCGATLFFNFTNITFANCGFERTKNAVVHADFRQPEGFNKGQLTLEQCWWEDEEEDENGAPPTYGCIRVAGRMPVIKGGHFTTAQTEDLRSVVGMPDGHALTFAGLDMTSAPCLGGEFRINQTSSNLYPEMSVGCNGNKIKGFYNASKAVDSGKDNTWDCLGSGIDFPHKTKRFQVRRSHTSVAETDYILDALIDGGTEEVRLFGNILNALINSSGNLKLQSALNLIIQSASGSVSTLVKHAEGNNFNLSTDQGSSGWQYGHIVMGSNHLWFDSTGRLRAKNGAPTGDTDGTIVGVQSL